MGADELGEEADGAGGESALNARMEGYGREEVGDVVEEWWVEMGVWEECREVAEVLRRYERVVEC